MSDLSRRVVARFRQASAVRVLIDRDATLKVRERFSAHSDAIIGTFDSSFSLYRIFDGEEMARIVSTGKITGGTYAVKAEREHGASWGENISALISWGNRERGHRLGDDLFVAKLDAFDKRFFHLGPKLPFDPNGPAEQPATMEGSTCNAGLGCSVIDVGFNDVDIFQVSADGQMQRLSLAEAKAYAQGRPKKDVELREVSRVYFQGQILGVDVAVVLNQTQGSYYQTWSVETRDEKPFVLGAKTKEIAIEEAMKQIRSGGPKADAPTDLVHGNRGQQVQAFGLAPRDKFVVEKGNRNLGVGAHQKGWVKDVWQEKGRREVTVVINFVFPRKPPTGRGTAPLTLYATHANRLDDALIPLLSLMGDRIVIRKL